jgi:hypothetical protein
MRKHDQMINRRSQLVGERNMKRNAQPQGELRGKIRKRKCSLELPILSRQTKTNHPTPARRKQILHVLNVRHATNPPSSAPRRLRRLMKYSPIKSGCVLQSLRFPILPYLQRTCGCRRLVNLGFRWMGSDLLLCGLHGI